MSIHGDPLWVKNINILLKKDRLDEFFPSKLMTYEEKMNSISRFVLYTGLLLFLLKSKGYYLIASTIIVLFLGILSKNKTVNTVINKSITKSSMYDVTKMTKQVCSKPTKNNPFSNYNVVTSIKNKAPACPYDDVKDDINSKFNLPNNEYGDEYQFKRQFYSMPVTEAASDQTTFAEYLYGKKDRKVCKQDASVCTGRFP